MVSNAAFNRQLQQTLNRFYLQKSLIENPIEKDPFDKDPPRNVRSYRQSSSDEATDSTFTARNIGDLTRGKTRLNVVSALTTNDLVDFFRFKVTTDGKLGISVTTDKGVHIELLDRRGTVIADSEAISGTAKADNFKKLGEGSLELKADSYYLKVTRPTGLSRSEKPNYAIQLSMSRYFEADYDTIESPAARQSPASVTKSQSAGALNSVLNQLGLGNLFDFKA